MRKNRIAVAVAMAFPLSLPVWAQAQDAPSRELGVVTITGGQPTSLPTQIPTTMEGITREQIDQSINAMDSEDALKYFPSLLVRKRYVGDYNHAILSTRASGTGNSARSLVFADGIQLSNLLGNGVGGLSFPPRWGLVTPEEISRVDVMYGPFSAAYSGNSVGAVVDYQTRMPNKFEAHVASNFSYQPFDLYNTRSDYKAWQTSASLGSRSGAWSWWLAVNHMDSDGQPLTFATRLLSTGTAGSSGTAVTGAVQENNNAGLPWWIIGTGTQYHTRQDHAKIKIAYDFSPTARVSYTFGLWQNDVSNTPESYLRNAARQPVYSGAINIGGRAFSAVTGGDFVTSQQDSSHTIHGLSIKSNSTTTTQTARSLTSVYRVVTVMAAHTDGWEEAYTQQFSGAAGSPGKRPIVVSYATSPAAEVIFAGKPLSESPTAAVEDGCYRQIEYAGVLRGAPNESGARKLIDFMLSERFQADVPGSMFVYPVVAGVPLPREFKKHAIVPAMPLSLPSNEVAANRDAWVREWTDIVVR